MFSAGAAVRRENFSRPRDYRTVFKRIKRKISQFLLNEKSKTRSGRKALEKEKVVKPETEAKRTINLHPQDSASSFLRKLIIPITFHFNATSRWASAVYLLDLRH